MVTTVTTSTITSAAVAGSVVLIGILILLALLVQKELVTGIPEGRFRRLSTALNIGILPLLVAFVVVVAVKVAEVLK